MVISVINRPLQQYLGFTAGRWLSGQFEHKADSLIAKFKEAAERSERLMYEQSHRDYLRSPLSASSRSPPAWPGNHYRDNAIYKAQRDKNARESEAGERGNYRHADASLCCCRCKIHEALELADAKAENDALRDDVAAGRRRLRITVWSVSA